MAIYAVIDSSRKERVPNIKMPFSIESLIKIALILDEEEENRPSRRFWVHQMLTKRKGEGEFFTLFPELVDDESKFYQYFRMSHYDFMRLLGFIEADIQQMNTSFRECITPAEKLAVCLRFLATGDSFRTIAFSYRLGHSTVHAIVRQVCQAIINNLLSIYIPTPRRSDWEQIPNTFRNVWDFPNCIGCLDGKHVEIMAPSNSGSNYFNYKKTFSVVLLALVDADYNFIAVDIGSYGKNSDSGIFLSSPLGNAFHNGTFNIAEDSVLPGSDISAPHVILGDSAFPLKTYLMRPYPENQVQDNTDRRIFNYRHCRARRVVENAFGILTQRFRIYLRKINSKPDYVENIILTTCILHNYLRYDRLHLMESAPSNEETASALTNLPRLCANAQQAAFNTREKFKTYFNSPAGSVPWQNDRI
ncbi:uncharacterized protein [Anabrus simplex]|uniref:uncharacterized protein n=1 Tax=Anabrus simplex TaxID=316456 RepID=UPI0035A3A230